ncbi:uncharacterized protein [Drosophila kikkawai]|uniref:Uncharacterized protein n=1 Tax=Drosophila kikkawai TaxID=30033 RepID=A0A6P4IH62_DROKI|nr:uncharacterized protein LOC108074519 [Drosophila kikkawai]
MFRLLMLGNKLSVQRNLVTRLTARSNVPAGLVYRSAHRSRVIDGVVVVDVNLDDMSKGDIEFARSFAKSVSSLDRSLFQTAVGPAGKTENQLPSLEDAVPADGSLPAGTPSTVMGQDGKPIVHVEIDGWNQDNEEGEDASEPKNNQDANIKGNESADK